MYSKYFEKRSATLLISTLEESERDEKLALLIIPHQRSFLTANRGTQPLHAWQTIIAGRDLLKKGLRYIIGNGSMIHTWSDPWLDAQPPRPPQRRNNNQCSHLKVQNLFDKKHNTWEQGTRACTS